MGAALALGGCGGDSSGSGTNVAATSSTGSSGVLRRRAVEDQLGFDQAGILARQSRVEAAIAQCMKNEGFDYIPIDPFAQRAALVGSSRLSDEDFLKQFGYGISTLWGRGNPQADPNQRLRATLGPRIAARTTARCGARTRAPRSRRPSTAATSTVSGAAR
jgi:hypothetical protein